MPLLQYARKPIVTTVCANCWDVKHASNANQYYTCDEKQYCRPKCLIGRWRHLLFNAVAQLVVGIPLELLHGARKTAVIYIAGIFAGAQSVSCYAKRQQTTSRKLKK